jgi:hypothetical protein
MFIKVGRSKLNLEILGLDQDIASAHKESLVSSKDINSLDEVFSLK